MRNGSVITVVIPALNEEAAITGVIARIPDWVGRIVVVDNGSTDRTTAVARAAGAVVVSEPRRGYGRACLTGIIAAEGDPYLRPDVLVFLDADGSDFPEQMDRIVDPLADGRADLVIGSRTRGKLSRGAMTAPQRFGNMLAPVLIRWLWGARYTDLGPFRAIRVSSLRALRMDDNTYGWTIQMQIRAARLDLRTLEVPVDYGPRRAGKSKISGSIRGVVKAGTKILACVGRERLWPPNLHPGSRESLGVLAKYPEPGRVKTRLIPALGPEGAAALHNSMVRHTLTRVSEFRGVRETETCVYAAGADPGAFACHFDTQIPCVAQSPGDLGQRVLAAFRHLLRDATAAVIIGSDCPDISPGLLTMAFESLRSSDVVLGPARDGGYYLVGLRRPAPALFENMEWSTATVLAKTLERAAFLGLSVQLLPALNDVDEPADLAVWERVQTTMSPTDVTPSLSVIVPTLNEQGRIGGVVDAVRQNGVEVIVADGGSDDDTRAIAAAHGARVIIAFRGRGPQLNAGAALARGHHMLFLHADTTLPENFREIVQHTLSDPTVAVGAFRFKLDRAGVLFRAVELAVMARCSIFKTPYGDQAFFIRHDLFTLLKGYAPIPLMEDIDLVRRARRIGRVVIVEAPALTSARRWELVGVVRMTAINQACALGFAIGISPQKLTTWRNRLSGKRAAQIGTRACAGQIVPEGSLVPNDASAICMAAFDSDVRK